MLSVYSIILEGIYMYIMYMSYLYEVWYVFVLQNILLPKYIDFNNILISDIPLKPFLIHSTMILFPIFTHIYRSDIYKSIIYNTIVVNYWGISMA